MVTAATPAADWLVVAPVVVTILAGSVLVMLRSFPRLQPIIAIAAMAVLVLSNSLLLVRVAAEGPLTMTMGRWLPPFGISFSADVLGATLSLTASVVALAVAVYGVRDVPSGLRRFGFYPCLVLMMAGVSGAFLTGDVFNLYVWFEVLLIASFGLIVLGNGREQLDGAIRYAILNLLATTLFLIAVGYLYGLTGTLNMADIAGRLREMGDIAPINTIAALFILAFAMKAAAFPVNFWLPASYHTPMISVAALFAGLLTKVGVYALLRVIVMLMPEQRSIYADVLAAVAIATMLIAGLGAVAQSDLRRMLGYFVITGIGAMIAGLALGTQLALAGATFYAVHSMIVSAALYLGVGLAGRVGRSFDSRALGGIYARAPWLSAVFLVLVFAIAGLPPFSGFWPKVLITEAALEQGRWILAASVLLSGFLTTIAGGRAFALSFWRGGPLGMPDGTSDEAALARLPAGETVWLLAPMAFLAALAVLIGLWPDTLMTLADASALALLDPSAYVRSVFGGSP